jgi:hypothetical protein
MPPARGKRFTIFDMMDEKGAFDSNPANPSSRDSEGAALYSGPVEFPKMLYSPKGEYKIINPGEWIDTPRGVQLIGEQKELISMIVNSKKEETVALADGWFDHPSDSIKVSLTAEQRAMGKTAPSKGIMGVVSEKDATIAALQAQLEEARKGGFVKKIEGPKTAGDASSAPGTAGLFDKKDPDAAQ